MPSISTLLHCWRMLGEILTPFLEASWRKMSVFRRRRITICLEMLCGKNNDEIHLQREKKKKTAGVKLKSRRLVVGLSEWSWLNTDYQGCTLSIWQYHFGSFDCKNPQPGVCSDTWHRIQCGAVCLPDSTSRAFTFDCSVSTAGLFFVGMLVRFL